MANDERLTFLQQGVDTWNKLRLKGPGIRINLRRADLSGTDLRRADLSMIDLRWSELSKADLRWSDLSESDLRRASIHSADLREANLSETYLNEADLSESDLRRANLSRTYLNEADLSKADLSGADLREADLHEADLRRADLSGADLSGADLSGADLSRAIMIETNLERAILTGCTVYGISAWGLELSGAKQKDLVITSPNEPVITVDDLEVAQFIYLLIHNEKIRYVIDTITSKVVLILGRFTPERKSVLDAIREELRSRGYLPVLFDFEKPVSRGLTETVSTLAHMAKFIIADITDAKSIPAELAHIIPQLPSVPIQPLILSSDYEYAMFEFIRKFNCVLEPYRYEDQEKLIIALGEKVIAPAEAKVKELRNPAR